MYVSMKGMLKRANEGNYAVMAINCFNIETARAVINAAQSLRAPIHHQYRTGTYGKSL
mgnify:CR=1 FL=1